MGKKEGLEVGYGSGIDSIAALIGADSGLRFKCDSGARGLELIGGDNTHLGSKFEIRRTAAAVAQQSK